MELQILKQQELLGREITVYGTNENPLFLAKDVAEWIEHSDTSMMMKSVDDDEKLIQTILVSGQKRDVLMLTENGLYEVLMLSRKPIAKEIKKGIKHILKEIRLNGGYIASHENDTPEMIMARGLQVAMQTIENIKSQNQKLIAENTRMDMRTQFLDAVFNSDEHLSLSTTTKLLKLPFGRNNLCKSLREKGIFFQNSNEPKQEYCERGYFFVFANFKPKINKTITQTFVTQKGLAWLAKIYGVVVPQKNPIQIL